jgi:hypothetical protein
MAIFTTGTGFEAAAEHVQSKETTAGTNLTRDLDISRSDFELILHSAENHLPLRTRGYTKEKLSGTIA